MRLAFWKKAAPSGECVHLWTNWSEPTACDSRVLSFSFGGGESTSRDGLKQDRHCLHCNMYERRVA